MKLIILGGTGGTGQHVVEQALAAGHEVVALARTPSKFKAASPKLKIVQGDILDAAKVEEAIRGADAVVSALGPSSNKPEFLVSKGIQNVIAAMKKHGVKRLIQTGGGVIPDPNDQPKLMNHAISLLLKLVAKNVVEDMTRAVNTIRQTDLDWTVVRAPRLIDTPKTGNVRVGWVGVNTGTSLSRADFADFLLRQLADNRFVRQAPMISN